MPKLKKSIIEQIKKNLLAQKTELEAKNYQQQEVDVDGDETDEIQANIIINVNKQLASRDKQKLAQIKTALDRIEDKSYGKCEECEEMIGEKRLEVNPYCQSCISCAEQKELEMKQRVRK